MIHNVTGYGTTLPLVGLNRYQAPASSIQPHPVSPPTSHPYDSRVQKKCQPTIPTLRIQISPALPDTRGSSDRVNTNNLPAQSQVAAIWGTHSAIYRIMGESVCPEICYPDGFQLDCLQPSHAHTNETLETSYK